MNTGHQPGLSHKYNVKKGYKTENREPRPGLDDNVSAFSLSPVYGRICRGVDAERLRPGLARVAHAHIVMMIMIIKIIMIIMIFMIIIMLKIIKSALIITMRRCIHVRIAYIYQCEYMMTMKLVTVAMGMALSSEGRGYLG